jgi:hypothetical protein
VVCSYEKAWDIGAIAGVLDGYAVDIPFLIRIKKRVFVQGLNSCNG